MRSITARLTAWYALAVTVTLACLLVVGYQLLHRYLIHGLDLLNAAEFSQIRARLGPDYASLSAAVIDQRIRETSEYASVLFYIDIDNHAPGHSGPMFYSNNLGRQLIPDVPGKHVYTAHMRHVGELRVGVFDLPPFDVTIATPSSHVAEVMRGYAQVSAALLAAMLLLSIVVGLWLAYLALKPVRLIRETASHIGSDNLGERIPVAHVQDEISDLARLLNQMFDRLEASFRQVRRFAAEASHELKTPLSLIRLQAEKLLVGGKLPAAQEEAVQMQLEEVARMNHLIEDLLFLSRAQANAIHLRLEPHDANTFLNQFAQDARVLAEHHGLAFELRLAGSGMVSFEDKRLRQVLLNLLTNAIGVCQAGGHILLDSQLGGGRWRLTVEDDGPGVPGEDLDRIFDHFVRLTPQAEREQGTGLGLAISRSIVELHRGRISAHPGRGGRGLAIVVDLPATAAPRADWAGGAG